MMLESIKIGFLFTAILFTVTACRRSPVGDDVRMNAPASPTPYPPSNTAAVDKWLGRWQGVEGTYLFLSKKGDSYTIEIADLDGAKTYEGRPAIDHIVFIRNDKTEAIRATTGKGTGMKHLVNEKNCLVVRVGSEGFCRKSE